MWDQFDFAASNQRRLNDWNVARAAPRRRLGAAPETGRADAMSASVARLREWNESAARTKGEAEGQGLLFGCHELLCRNVGTSTIFAGLTDDDLMTLASIMAQFIASRQ